MHGEENFRENGRMEHSLIAPFDGTVTDLAASEGGQVQVEAVLCVVEPAE